MRTWIIFTWIISCCLGSQALGKKAAQTEESWLGKLTPEAQKLIKNSRWIGQGNPKPTKHPMTRQQCQNKLKKLNVSYDNPKFEKICGAPYMAPLYNPNKEKIADATTCIDQFEFPNQPCEYPIVWVRAKEAAEICNAMGKRICDAHEWEGGCEGRLLAPDYDFSLGKPTDANIVKRRRLAHNKKNEKTWAMGKKWQKGQCATGGSKSRGCNGGNWQKCGSNTFPAGARAGYSLRAGFEGGQMPLFRKLPQRGFNRTRFQIPCAVVNLGELAKLSGDKVDLESLKEAGLIRANSKRVKLLGTGEADKAYQVNVTFVSKTAKEKIESAGGSFLSD